MFEDSNDILRLSQKRRIYVTLILISLSSYLGWYFTHIEHTASPSFIFPFPLHAWIRLRQNAEYFYPGSVCRHVGLNILPGSLVGYIGSENIVVYNYSIWDPATSYYLRGGGAINELLIMNPDLSHLKSWLRLSSISFSEKSSGLIHFLVIRFLIRGENNIAPLGKQNQLY